MVNEWTSNDVPSVSSLGLYDKRPDLDISGMRFGAAVALEAVVEHLNSVYPKPRPVTREDVTQAVRRGHNMFNAEAGVVNEMCDLLGIEAETAVARAEAAEARTAVTREDVEKAIDGIVPVWDSEIEKIVVALHKMVAGDDPAVLVVRESDVASVSVVKHDVNEWEADGKYAPHADVAAARKGAAEWIAMATRCEAVARAIEAEQAAAAADPLLGKAQEFAALADWELTDREAELLHTVAAHVLGQEAGQ